MGASFQIGIHPRDAYCPRASSKKKSGKPARARHTAYGIKKAPVTGRTTGL